MYYSIGMYLNDIQNISKHRIKFNFTRLYDILTIVKDAITILCILFLCEVISLFYWKFENIILVKNKNILEKRAVNNMNEVVVSITLEQQIKPSFDKKILSLSNDGELCVIGGTSKYFYLIDFTKKK
eukprot:50738_1